MSAFQYTAVTSEGKVIRGKMTAHNEYEVEKRLEGQGCELIQLQQARIKKQRHNKAKMRQELMQFTVQLEQLTRASVPLFSAIEDLRDSCTYPPFKAVLEAVSDAIEGGKTLSDALKDFPALFDSIYIMLVRIGEQSGSLPHVLADLADSLKWQDEISSQAKKMLMYPAFVGVAVISVIVFLMVYLLPQLIPFIKEMDGEIPLHTQVLISFSVALKNYGLYALPCFFLVPILFKTALRRYLNFKRMYHRLLLKIALIGEMVLLINLARFANYFALMYQAGISVLEGLKMCEGLMTNLVLKEAISDAHNLIEQGTTISDSFAEVKIFPPMVVRMVKVGENTGQIDQALKNVSYFYSREVKETIDKLVPMLEPVLTVVLGLMMAWIMIAVLGPVYDTMGNF